MNSFCTEYCRLITSIQWILYQGLNSSNGLVTWRPLNHSTRPTNTSLFGKSIGSDHALAPSYNCRSGMRASNLTVMEQLWLDYRYIELWRFDVIYSFGNQTSKSALHFQVNHPPKNASCSLYPINGTTQARFTISCQDWFDDEGFADDYSVYGRIIILIDSRVKAIERILAWATDPTDRWMLVWTSTAQFQLRLPAGDRTTSALNVLIRIRCPGQSTMEWNLAPTYVTPVPRLTDLVRDPRGSNNDTDTRNYLSILIDDDQNMATQILTILAQEMSYQNVKLLSTISSGKAKVPPTSFYCSFPDNESTIDGSSFEVILIHLSSDHVELDLFEAVRDTRLRWTLDHTRQD